MNSSVNKSSTWLSRTPSPFSNKNYYYFTDSGLGISDFADEDYYGVSPAFRLG